MKNKTIKEIITLLTAVLLAFAFIGCPSPDDTCSHDYQYKTTIAPTCTAEGAEIETCTKCNATRGESRPIAKLSHSFADGECTACTAADPDYTAPACACPDKVHANACPAPCTGKGVSPCTCTDPCTHNWQWVETTPATYDTDGVETETCTICGETNGTRPILKFKTEQPFTIGTVDFVFEYKRLDTTSWAKLDTAITAYQANIESNPTGSLANTIVALATKSDKPLDTHYIIVVDYSDVGKTNGFTAINGQTLKIGSEYLVNTNITAAALRTAFQAMGVKPWPINGNPPPATAPTARCTLTMKPAAQAQAALAKKASQAPACPLSTAISP